MDLALASSEQQRDQRFQEATKFLPVVFVAFNIAFLYLVYIYLHCVPRLAEPAYHGYTSFQMLLFNISSAFLVINYLHCLMVHPGTIPESADDPRWSRAGSEPPSPSDIHLSAGLQEWKKTGNRRMCKWCDKLKPDRCHHCRVCRICVLRMDHHCPWIYNCVGFRNHKYFFLVLLYATICCNMIVWTMLGSVKEALDPSVPFLTMFPLMFGQTLASFLGLLVTVFFSFHIYLMFSAMTTIEFCEKSLKRPTYDSSTYDRGIYGNICAVLGDNPFLWFLPVSTPSGSGLEFLAEDTWLFKAQEGWDP